MKKSYLLQFFTWAHLPAYLASVSEPFGALAQKLDETLPENAEKATAIRKLLEAKDCAVRAVLWNNDMADNPEPLVAPANTDAANPETPADNQETVADSNSVESATAQAA